MGSIFSNRDFFKHQHHECVPFFQAGIQAPLAATAVGLVRSLAAFLVALAERLPHVWDAQLTGGEAVVRPTFVGCSLVHQRFGVDRC